MRWSGFRRGSLLLLHIVGHRAEDVMALDCCWYCASERSNEKVGEIEGHGRRIVRFPP